MSCTLYRSADLDASLDRLGAGLAALPAVPTDALARPAALLLPPSCSAWLDLVARDPCLVSLALVEPIEGAAHDPRFDDVITPQATRAELLMRAERALARKRVAAPMPVVAAEGLRSGDRFVALSAAEARLAARLLETLGATVSEGELCEALSVGAPISRRALHTHIYRLRKTLAPIPELTIEVVRQRGFRAELRDGHAPPPPGGSTAPRR